MHGSTPLDKGVDVISVGTAFKRFLEIAAHLDLEVSVVIDNDGDVKRLERRFKDYIGGSNARIRIFYDADAQCATLEPQILRANGLALVNSILGQNFQDESELGEYMTNRKTEWALKFFKTSQKWTAPEYIKSAIK